MSTPNLLLTSREAKRSRRSGQSATEYLLMIAFIVLVGVGLASTLGTGIQGILANINSKLQAALGTTPSSANPKG